MDWLIQAADQGHADAMYRVGVCCVEGVGTGKETCPASNVVQICIHLCFRCHEFASVYVLMAPFCIQARGRAELKYESPDLNRASERTPLADGEPNDDDACKWFEQAAGLGHLPAQHDFAAMLLMGRGAKREDRRAASLLLAAADKGHKPSMMLAGSTICKCTPYVNAFAHACLGAHQSRWQTCAMLPNPVNGQMRIHL
jgi:TPR repeat protein